MKWRIFLSSSVFASAVLLIHAGTPKQGWSSYCVHDDSRPKPEKVKAAAAVLAAPPADAKVLFDGKDASNFTSPWKVVDGAMVADKADTFSKQSFGSCQLHIEWRVPADRRVIGQIGGNSGVFLMGLYEVQVQESHTNVTYADGQAAAIYGQTPPLVNASLPKGEWQSYDIIFQAPKYGEKGIEKPAYVTVIHNGVVVHSNQEIYGPTVYQRLPSYPATHPEKAPLRLQFHGDPIEYRNIWVRDLP